MKSASERIADLKSRSAIKKMRERLGFTQQEFAVLAGVSQGHISRVELLLADPGDKVQELIDEVQTYIQEANEINPKLREELQQLMKEVLRERLSSNNSGRKYVSRKR